ncbi:hypothetical protein GGF32_005663 [Allomyces javanicus]|nr:hypothetical protein GGF32_005663 [Allomyces javanicus]
MSYPPRKGPLYDNLTVLGPDGAVLFRCGRKKFDWYLTHGLATQVDDTTIALNFAPKGPGRAGQEWYLEDRQDQCVVCGAEHHLVLVHIVPSQYRRYMPLRVKSRSNIDLQPFCTTCHAEYDTACGLAKKTVAAHYGIPVEGGPWVKQPDWTRARKAASALLSAKTRSKLPAARMAELVNHVVAVINDPVLMVDADDHALVDNLPFTHAQLMAVANLPDAERGDGFVEHGEGVVAALMAERDRRARLLPSPAPSPSPPVAEDDMDVDFEDDDDDGPEDYMRDSRATLPSVPPEHDPLVAFVRMWRMHFLTKARPQFLSPAYDVNADIMNP